MATYFPFITNEELTENTEPMPLYKEIAWDYDNDKIVLINGSPKIVEGNEAIKVWVYKAIKTMRYKYPIYTWEYGCEMDSLLGKGLQNDLIKSETKRYIEEALLINPYILSVSDIEVELNESILGISCSLETVYGTNDIEYNFNSTINS